MAQHPIEGLMKSAMESIKDMVDVNTIVGDPVQSPDGTVIIPISKVSFGFAAGGGEFYGGSRNNGERYDEEEEVKPADSKFPFAGGSGAGVSINPVAFMVVGQGQFKLMSVDVNSSFEKVVDLIPELIGKICDITKKKISAKRYTDPSEVHKEDDELSDD